MTRNHSCQLLDILAEVPDLRHKKGERYQGYLVFGFLGVFYDKCYFLIAR